MYQGLHSDIFLQAEVDYRHQRLVGEFKPKSRSQAAQHHLPWPLHRDASHHRRHPKPVVS
jgi:hypothetical protein